MSKRNRSAGIKWELECADILREIFPHVVTSRSESRSRDNKKVDLTNTDEDIHGRLPINFQCKTTASAVNYSKLLAEMPEEMVNCVLHKYTKKSGTKFMTKGKYVIMDMNHFINLLKEVYGNGR